MALKASSPDLPHKSDSGFVHLNVRREEEVDAIATDMFDRMAKAGSGHPKLLVAQMLLPSPELIVGSRRIRGGAVSIVLGIGGVGVELIDDAAAALAPLSEADAHSLISNLRSQRLLDGWRGLPPVPRSQLAYFLMRFSCLAYLARNHVREIDINPLMVSGGALVAADALVVVEKRSGQDSS